MRHRFTTLFGTESQLGRVLVKFESGWYIVLIAVSLLLWSQFAREREASLTSSLGAFQEQLRAESNDIAADVEATFRQIYQGVRTIARLPGVRAVDRDTRQLSGDTRVSAQEIYNNLAQNVAVSELYIVPAQFDPDATDPVTGTPHTPLTTFDELIVGRNADQPKAVSGALTIQTAEPEIEIYEYREMRRQIAWFREHFPKEDSVAPLNYPAIVSSELITCDNTHFSPAAPNDKDRSGLVYSVPFYSREGALAGIVSAVILTDILTSHIPNGMHAIKNDKMAFLAGSKKDRFWFINAGGDASDAKPHAFALRQERPLNVPGASSGWLLWSAAPSQAFDTSAPVRAVNGWYLANIVSLVSCMGALAAVLRWQAMRNHIMAERNQDLEVRIAERTAALAQSKREAEQANSAKSQFLASVSHEIRTPMHAIMSAADLLAVAQPLPSAARKISIIQGASRSLLDLVNQVLEMSAIEQRKLALSFSAFSPAALVENTCSMLAASAKLKGIELTTQHSGAVAPLIVSDAGRIRQVLINLIGNAIKFTDSGFVSVTLSNAPCPVSGQPLLCIQVCDTGRGIPANLRANLFQPFGAIGPDTPVGVNSVGLGLAISKQLADLLGGCLELDETYLGGTRFRFTIPYATQQEPGLVCNQDGSLPAGSRVRIGARVLLAEDHPDLQILTCELLERLGCDVTVAVNGRRAVDLSAKAPFDIILMDSLMPELCGPDATRIIRAREAATGAERTPIIALTADIFDNMRDACLAAGMTDFLAKPYSIDCLAAAIRKNLPQELCGRARVPAAGIHPSFNTMTASADAASPGG